MPACPLSGETGNDAHGKPPSLPAPRHPGNQALRRATSPPEVSDAIQARVTQRLWRAPATSFLITDEDSPSDEDASPVKRRRCTIKSGRLRTMDTHVVQHVKWPHERVFSSQGQASVYEEMSLALIANGYLASVKEYMYVHLRYLFEGVDVYGRKAVREYHTAWLHKQLLKQGRAAWGDESKRAQLQCLKVWSKPSLSSRLRHLPSASGTSNSHPQTQGQGGRPCYVPPPSKPGNRGCLGYNRGVCSSNASHLSYTCAFIV